jgi:UDP-glucuronate decarboxylase
MNTSDNFTGPVNLGNSDEFTILELAELIVDLTKSNSKIVFKPLPQDDPVRRRPDISLAKEKLKWSPNIKLHEGLVKTIEYFDKLLVQIPQKQASLRN